MRITIDIDEALIVRAMHASGAKTKEAAVLQALGLLVRLSEQHRAVQDMYGLGWEGDLETCRNDCSH